MFSALHVLGAILFFSGILLLLAWAAKTLTPQQLKMKALILIGVGILACLLGALAHGNSRGSWTMYEPGMKMMHVRMMKDMPEGGMHHDMDDMEMEMDPMSMSMDDMALMLEGKTGDEFDQAFIEGMIPHHQGAIDMAKMALTSAKHDEIKRMAEAIISAQQKEIDEMNQWMKNWGYAQ